MVRRAIVWSVMVVLLCLGPAGGQEPEPESGAMKLAHDNDRIERQIAQLQEYLKENPTSSEAYRRLLGLLQTQTTTIEEGVETGSPEHSVRKRELADQMREVAEAWVRRSPGEPDAVLALAAHQRSNKEREGILTTAVRRFPNNLHAHQLLAHALAEHDPHSGGAVLDRFAAQHPDDREAFVSLLLYCQAVEDTRRMRSALDRWLARRPDDPSALKVLLEHFGGELAEAELTHKVEQLLAGEINGQDHIGLCSVVLRQSLSVLGKSCAERALSRDDVQADRQLFFKAQQYFIWSSVLLGEWRDAERMLSTLRENEVAGLQLSMSRSLARLQRCEDVTRLLDSLDIGRLEEEQREEVLELRTGCGDRQAGYQLWHTRLEAADAVTLSQGLRQIRDLIPPQEFFEIMLGKLDEAPDRKPFLDVLVPYLFGLSQEERSSQASLLAAWLAYRRQQPERQASQWLLEDLVTAVYGRGLQISEKSCPVADIVEALMQRAGAPYVLDAEVAQKQVSIALGNAAWPQQLDAVCAMAGCSWQVREGSSATVEIHSRALQHPTLSVAPGPVGQVIGGIAKAGGYRLELDPQVDGALQLHLGEIEWPTALDLVCRHAGCRWKVSNHDPRLIEVTTADTSPGS